MKKKVFIIIGSVIAGLVLVAIAPLAINGIKTVRLNSDYEYLKEDEKYSKAVEVEGFNLVKQEISCGYASIEMLSTYYGETVTEKSLDEKNNGAVSTATSAGFYKEIKESIPQKSFVKHAYLKNDKLLKEVHDSLSKSNPVTIEWAAKFEGEWTLHYSVVTGLDLTSDNVSVYNPYGYIENIKVEEFISRTSFKAYRNKPFFYDYAFAFGMFEKNTIIYAD